MQAQIKWPEITVQTLTNAANNNARYLEKIKTQIAQDMYSQHTQSTPECTPPATRPETIEKLKAQVKNTLSSLNRDLKNKIQLTEANKITNDIYIKFWHICNTATFATELKNCHKEKTQHLAEQMANMLTSKFDYNQSVIQAYASGITSNLSIHEQQDPESSNTVRQAIHEILSALRRSYAPYYSANENLACLELLDMCSGKIELTNTVKPDNDILKKSLEKFNKQYAHLGQFNLSDGGMEFSLRNSLNGNNRHEIIKFFMHEKLEPIEIHTKCEAISKFTEHLRDLVAKKQKHLTHLISSADPLMNTPGSRQATLNHTELQGCQPHLNAAQAILSKLQQEKDMAIVNVVMLLKHAQNHIKTYENAWLETVNANNTKRNKRISKIQQYLDTLSSEGGGINQLTKRLEDKKQQIKQENANALGMLAPIPMLKQNSTQPDSGSTTKPICPQTPPRSGSTCNRDRDLNNPFAAIREANDLRIKIISTIISSLGSDTPNDSALVASHFLRSTAALLVLIEHIESVSHIKIKNQPRYEAAIDKLDALLDAVISQPKTSASSVQPPCTEQNSAKKCPCSPAKPKDIHHDTKQASPAKTTHSKLFTQLQPAPEGTNTKPKQGTNPKPKRRRLNHG